MNEIIKSQSLVETEKPKKVVEKTTWVNGTQIDTEMQLNEGDNPSEYYYIFLRGGETFYTVSISNFDRIMTAINNGAKFVKANDDIININEIKRFKKH